MTDAHRARKKRDEGYRRTRDTFDDLPLEDQATFLVEATASLLAHGLEEAGRAVADGLDDLFRTSKSHEQEADSTTGPGPAEPETAQQRRPRGGSSDTSTT